MATAINEACAGWIHEHFFLVGRNEPLSRGMKIWGGGMGGWEWVCFHIPDIYMPQTLDRQRKSNWSETVSETHSLITKENWATLLNYKSE